MSWRLMCVAALLAMTLGCDRHTNTLAGPSPLSSTGNLTVVIVTGGSFLTTGFSNIVTVPRGSTLTFVNNDTTPHMLPIAGTVRPAFLEPGGQAFVTLPDVGTFTFCCTFGSNTTVTIIVV